MFYLGLGKTLFNSSACLFERTEDGPQIELVLSERILRKKASGAWPEQAIRSLESQLGSAPLLIGENRDVHHPAFYERSLNDRFPFYDYLKTNGLSRFSSYHNPQLEFFTHHFCHAMAAVAMSPFEKCAIVVMDGAGSKLNDFPVDSDERLLANGAPGETNEECSIYLHDRGRLRCVHKRWRDFRDSKRHAGRVFSEGAGILYEAAAEYIFNSKRAAGKVMGLAAFGKPSPIGERWRYLEALDWTKAFSGSSKKDWESSGKIPFFSDIAASVQEEFEHDLLGTANHVRAAFPEYENVILTGGCALNCTANMKLAKKGLFREIYVPPFPGDESIGFGAASALYFIKGKNPWKPLQHEHQHGYFGPRNSEPTEPEIDSVFRGFEISKPPSIIEHAANLLAQGEIIAWLQGRSESGPRALGNRSILANPAMPGLKEKLNRDVKFREGFRPYGASCLQESATEYFDVAPGFNSPYMSFAVMPRARYRDALKEVCHVDGSSRIQTVRPGQNAKFHALLKAFGSKSGLSCLLNTSLNVMGEPIVETARDAKRFLESTPVHGLAIGDFYIRRKP